jgi:glutamate synthase domain-containing protein 3
MELVGFDEIDATDAIELHELVEEHHLRTLSPVAARVLEDWDAWLPRFVKVMPHDYKRALADMTTAEHAMRVDDERDAVADPVGVPHTGTSRQS